MANQMKSILSVCLALSVSTIFIDGVDGGACNWIPYCNNCTYDAGTQRATCHQCDPLFEKTTVNGFSKCIRVDGGACNWIPYCNNCTYDASTERATCHQCDPLFEETTVDGFSRCLRKCPDNCESCSIGGYDKCDECSQGFVIGDGRVCIRACETTHCKICSASQECTECESGYTLDSDAQCLNLN